MSLHYYLLGIFLMGVVDIIWEYRVGIFRKRIDSGVEHYHIALLLAILSEVFSQYSLLLLGMSTELLIREIVGDHPFAIGKRRFWYSTLLGVLLSIAYILLLL